ncbi:LysR family transcriptional regulator [Bradyrhizobium sp. Leo170]|uniref:LysR family transcriptional regulator n=1 Tax=Bradyrhizobium sp. Leo170 TaxID=1571199 RepID=UPI001FE0DEAF|nr:LysR family transcriptional regulator [Bradyrhizobium sp. Leo170]
MTEIEIRKNRRNAARAIDLQQLRLAVAACDYGSFGRAAEVLSIKHTVLSRSVGQLEHLVGTSLFDRSSGGIKPTLAGRAVLRIARLILEQVDALVTREYPMDAANPVSLPLASAHPFRPGICGRR